MILYDFLRALGQWNDPRFRRIVWLGLALAVALLFAMYAALLGVVNWIAPGSITLPLVGEVTGLGTLLSFGSIIFMLVLSVFLMVPVASAFTGLFLDDVADAVEARHYPHLAPAPPVPFVVAAVDSVKYFALLVGLNLVALVFFAFSGPFGLVLFWVLNGYLLGREYFDMIALRRMSRSDARALRRQNRLQVWGAGVLMAAPLSLPLVNLLVPVMGAASFTHLFHRLTSAR